MDNDRAEIKAVFNSIDVERMPLREISKRGLIKFKWWKRFLRVQLPPDKEKEMMEQEHNK